MNDENVDLGERVFVDKISIPCKTTSLTFDKTAYNKNLLNGAIEREEFNKILEESSKILSQATEKKRANDAVKLPRFIIMLSMLSVILAICYIVALYFAATNKDLSITFVIIGILCITSAAVIAFGLSLFNFCRKIRKFKTLESFIKDDLDAYLGLVNKGMQNKCEFKFQPSKEQTIELYIYVKSAKALEDEMNEKMQQDYDEYYDEENKSPEGSRSPVSPGSPDGRLQYSDKNDDSKVGLRSKPNIKEIEMNVLTDKNSIEKIRGEGKKKYGGLKNKKIN